MSQDNASVERSAPEEPVGKDAKPSRVWHYVEDVRLEMKQVTWPTWHQVWSTTLVVLFFTFVMTAVIKVVDVLVQHLYQLITGMK